MNSAQNTFASEQVEIIGKNETTGYITFKLGNFMLSRDEYFAKITWTAKGSEHSHLMSVDAFLRAVAFSSKNRVLFILKYSNTI